MSSGRTPRASALRAARVWTPIAETAGEQSRERGRRLSSPPPTARSRKESVKSASPPPRSRTAVSPKPVASPRGRSKASAPQPAAHHEFEFGGPLGAAAITLGLPAVCYGLIRFCHADGCLTLVPLTVPPALSEGARVSLVGVLAFLAWFALCLGLHVLLPGARVQGTQLRNGKRLTYKLNAMRVLLAVAVIVCGATYSGVFDPTLVPEYFTQVLSGGIAFSFALAAYLYMSSFKGTKLLASGGDTGNAMYDFFIGRELNPRVGAIDLKQFCELTPGLIGWLFLDLCFAYTQFIRLGYVTVAMALVCAFQGLYAFDALACEPAILTTMDITTDGFGFMLTFGDLVWVPFTYSLQARYLMEHPVHLPWTGIAAIVALQAAGYIIFRGSNSQKDAFRRNPAAPEVAHLRSMPTKRGTRLIISGWWGIARHINYFGDWVMAWAWCLPCGFASIVPYFYVIYFGVLLWHRERRDEEACRAKYGDDWDTYCRTVKWRIIPYVY